MQPLHSSYKKHSNKLPIPVLGLALVLLINFASLTGSCTEQDRSSLLKFLRELSQDGGLAASWQDGTDCCKWDGITCNQDKTVTDVSLASRSLQGHISPSLNNLTGLLRLNLSHNLLSGALPQELVSSSSIIVIDVSFNSLNGGLNELPSSTPARPLQVLNISSAISPIIGHLEVLVVLDFSFNNLSGQIPQSIGNLTSLQVLHLSNNRLTGCFFFSLRSKHFITKNRSDNNGDVEAASFNSDSEHSLIMMTRGKGEEINLTFTDIVNATNNFDKKHIIGCGGYGLVYKAELPDGSKIAIKKLNSEMCLMGREFSAEVDALSMAQHANLVPFWGYCIQGNLRLLIYSFMENGSLDDWLHNRDDDASSFLDWPTRLKIAQGASRGLHYIHDVCKPHIVHRDIKSSNILLDKEFKSYVADFGLSRLVLPNKTHVTTELVGTLGYIPPEYGQAWVATLRGDMYSFGVVLLELLTGRRPVPILSTSEELVPWVHTMRSQGKQIEVLDPTLRGTGCEEQMLKVLESACSCVDRNPLKRPTIMEVVTCLDSIDADLKT
ncbi:hypothetical protein E2562_035099 [Oryza meyeriana var. granulata]|uniref:non-specific serine/threonine protein kinase n=1 Tax=Oryza meyeriana var. granulata TaxID=110450 RepID=A0A6G1FFA7_9ORYZ|nr:hypothetical protein E2562_035099 [Oryza meyeriana var. granulata]